MRSWLDGAVECGQTIEFLAQSLIALSDAGIWTTASAQNLGSLQALSQFALSYPEDLPRWIDFLRLQIKSRADGLGRLTALADSGTLKPRELVPAFHFAFYNTLARSVFNSESELAQATGMTQELLRQQFAAADKQAIRLYSQRVAALIDRRPIPYGNQSGPVRSWTELALIQNEINKQKRHIPIRQLIRRSANALLAPQRASFNAFRWMQRRTRTTSPVPPWRREKAYWTLQARYSSRYGDYAGITAPVTIA